MNFMGISSYLDYLPSSSTLSKIALTSATVAVSSFFYSGISSLPTITASLTAIGTFAVQQVKANEEKKIAEAQHQTAPHIREFLDRVQSYINDPSNEYKDENNQYSEETRFRMLELGEALKTNGFSIERGGDEFRVKYVPFQAAVEHAIFVTCMGQPLIENSKAQFVGAIHTAEPATPLCNEPKGKVSFSLIDPAYQTDFEKIKTVADRTITARRLGQVGVLYVAYPQEGLNKRDEKAQNIYKKTIEEYYGDGYGSIGIIDAPLECKSLPLDLSGATYVLTFEDGVELIFSMKATQINNPADKNFEWGMWFGTKENAPVNQRFEQVSTFLNHHGIALTNQ